MIPRDSTRLCSLLPPKLPPKNTAAASSVLSSTLTGLTPGQQNPQSGGWALCKREWIYGGRDPQTGAEHPGILDLDRPLGQERRPEDANRNARPWIRVMTVDPSPTKYTAALLLDIPQDAFPAYSPTLLDLHRGRTGITDLVTLMSQWHERYGFQVLIIELNVERAIQEFPEFQDFVRRSGITVVWQRTVDNKNHPEWGKQTLAGDVSSGRVRVPWGDADTRMHFQVLINELLEEIKTDDTVMALWFPKWNLPGISTYAGSGTFPGFGNAPGSAFHGPPRRVVDAGKRQYQEVGR